MCEGMLGGMCAGVLCEDILFCTMSVTEEQQLYAWWMECPGGVCEYVEEFAFGGSLVWCRIANMWYLHIIDLHDVATYYM